MSKPTIIALFTALASIGLGFAAQPASALICCSACYGASPPPMCKWGCSPTCAEDEGPAESALGAAPAGIVYDDTAAMCYVSEGSTGCGAESAAATF